MPRGRGPQHKGARRQFTDEDTLAREVQELALGGGGRNKKKDEASEDSDASGSGDEAKEAGAAGGSDDEDSKAKARGVEHLIESENPNRLPPATKSVKKLGTDAAAPELSRREREELQRQRDREAYERLHAQHKTAEAQADLARLAIVRAQREEAAKKREAERQSKEGDAQRRRDDVEKTVAAKPAAVGRGGRSRAKKEREKEKKQQAAGAADS